MRRIAGFLEETMQGHPPAGGPCPCAGWRMPLHRYSADNTLIRSVTNAPDLKVT
jgi:hypothetical protein